MTDDDVITYQDVANEMEMPISAKRLIDKYDNWNKEHGIE